MTKCFQKYLFAFIAATFIGTSFASAGKMIISPSEDERWDALVQARYQVLALIDSIPQQPAKGDKISAQKPLTDEERMVYLQNILMALDKSINVSYTYEVTGFYGSSFNPATGRRDAYRGESQSEPNLSPSIARFTAKESAIRQCRQRTLGGQLDKQLRFCE